MAGSEIKMKMSLDSTGVKAGIGKASESIKSFATTSMERLQKVGSFLQTGLVVGAGFLVGIKKSIDGMVEMGRAADRLGISTESFQKLAFAAKQTGVDTDRLADAMKDLDVKLQDGIMRGGSFAELIQELGMDMNELAKMPADQRMLAFSDAIKNASGSLSRFGADEFGDAMFELLPLLEMGSDGILELGKSAVIASDSMIEAAERAQRLIDGATQTITGYFSIVTGELLQTFEWIVTGATQTAIEVGEIFGNLGDIIMAALRLDWDGVKAGYDKMASDAEGAFGRIEKAMDDVIDEHIAANKKVDNQRTQMTADEIARTNKEIEADKKRASEREKSLEKIADLEKKAGEEREKREMASMTAQEKLVAIQEKILAIRKQIDDMDPFAKGADEEKAKKLLEIQKLITEEQKTQADVIEEQISARDAAMEQQMKGLELERAMAEAMGDNERVNALDRQIERQDMINELIREYNMDSGKAAGLVDKIIAQKEKQKQKELEVLKAQADGNEMLAQQLQGRIDKEQEAIDLMNEFNLSLEEATNLAAKLAAMRAGPDLNQSGFVTDREQREFDRRQAVIERGQQKLREQEERDERQVGGFFRPKRIPEDISRAQKAREREEDKIRRAENSQLQKILHGGRTLDLGGNFIQAQAEVDKRRAQRQQVEQGFQEREKRAAQIEDPWERAAELRAINRQEKEAQKRIGKGQDIQDIIDEQRQKEAERQWKEGGADPNARFDLNGNLLPPGAPGGPDGPKQPEPKKPNADVVKAINDNGGKLDKIIQALQCEE